MEITLPVIVNMQSNVAELPLTHKLWAWFETNRKPVLVGIGVVAVVALVIWVIVYQQQEKHYQKQKRKEDSQGQSQGRAAVAG